MLRRASFVRTRFSQALSYATQTVAAAAAAAVTYLLKAQFGDSDQALADGDILSEGTGDLTMSLTSGTLAVASNKLKLDPLNNNSPYTDFAIADGKTFAEGTALISTFNKASLETTGDHYVYAVLSDSASYASSANRLAQIIVGDGTSAPQLFQTMTYSPAGTLQDNMQTNAGPAYTAGQDVQLAMVRGGFTSGTPGGGTEGILTFARVASGDWNLLTANDTVAWATVYPVLTVNETTAANQADASVTFDNIIIPTAADTSAFTPTGYALESTVTGSTTYTHIADQFLTFKITTLPSSGNIDILFRTDWALRVSSAGATSLLEDYTGTPTSRATSGTASNGSVVSVRMSGQTIEVWVDGANRGSYGSATVNQTATAGSVGSLGTGGAVAHIYSLPLTSATYNTAFDTSALTAADCDLYHTFDAIGDTTLANGDVIYGDYVDNGSLTASIPGSATASITSNALVCTPTSADPIIFHDTVSATRAAGQVLKWSFVYPSSPASTATDYLSTFVQATDASNANSAYALAYGKSDQRGFWVRTWDPPGSNDDLIEVETSFSDGDTLTMALVLGGWASGAPSASGAEGAFGFYKINSGSWNLIGALPEGSVNIGRRNWIVTRAGTTGTYSGTMDDCLAPDPTSTTVEGVFQPTGYALDTFTGSNGTGLESHVGETDSWASIMANTSFEINGNTIYRADGAFGDTFGLDTGLSDFFYQARFVKPSNGVVGAVWRATGTDDFWSAELVNAQFTLYETTGGSLTNRAQDTGATSKTDHVVSVRCSGNVHEVWSDGGDKLTYSSSVRNTATIHGGKSNPSNTIYYTDWMSVLPLTSATYDSELDVIDGS